MAKNEYICDCNPINPELVQETRKRMLPDRAYERVAGFFKIVGDPTRCKIVSALSMNEMCVGDIANVLSMRKSGKEVYYSLDDEHVAEIFSLTVAHMDHLAD